MLRLASKTGQGYLEAMSLDLLALRENLRQRAVELGAAACGFCSVEPLERGRAALLRWLERGAAANMTYMARDAQARAEPRALLRSARSALVVAVCYARPGSKDVALRAGEARVARYARGEDYHRVLRELLAKLANTLAEYAPGASTRVCVDTSPLLERELAMRAGVGFIGKNTLLVTPGVGSYTLLGVLLSGLPLPPDAPAEARCGRCTRCLEACPTNALAAEGYDLDARRCLSYLTIEHGGALDDQLDPDQSLRLGVGDRIFGCDACQDVCPYNSGTRRSAQLPVDRRLDASLHPAALSLSALLTQRSGDYRRLVRGRALARASRPQLARNAALVAASSAHDEAEQLADALEVAATDTRPEVAVAAAWAQKERKQRGENESS